MTLLEKAESYLKMQDTQFKKIVESSSLEKLQQINSELNALLRRYDVKSLEREKILALKQILDPQLHKMETEHYQQQETRRHEQAVQKLKQNAEDLRVCTNSTQVQGYQRQIYTLEVLEWQKLNGLTFEVQTRSGKKQKIDLTHLPANAIERLFSKRLTPLILNVEAEGMLTKNGYVRGFWQPREFQETATDRYNPATYIALMWV